MALLDPYSPCPCGSGKKLKWCCHKAEPFAERALRLVENGQLESALSVLEEGLSRFPDNPWLLFRKTVLLTQLDRFEEARTCVARVLAQHPDHPSASPMMIRLLLAEERPLEAVSQLQHALLHASPGQRASLTETAVFVGLGLVHEGRFLGALKHLELSRKLEGPTPDESDESEHMPSAQQMILKDPAVSPWMKCTYELAQAPAGTDDSVRSQFEQALQWAHEGLWESAASAFDLLSADRVAGLPAERNTGLCRLWMGDDRGGVAALRRWIKRAEPSPDVIDLAVVCVALDEGDDPEPVEQVRLSWPLRDRVALLRSFEANSSIVEGPDQDVDAEDEKSSHVDTFYWLDRPKIDARPGLTREQIPFVRAEVLIDSDSVTLQADDDGRLNELIDGFAALAGQAVPPAHPRTKVLGKVSRERHALSWHWYLPPDLDPSERSRLNREQTLHVIRTRWVDTPSTVLEGRTPRQASRLPELATLLRASLLNLETSEEEMIGNADWTGLRAELGIPPEPVLDPQSVEIDALPPGRLVFVPLERVDDARLKAYYLRVKTYGLSHLQLKAARELVRRPAVFDDGQFREVALYGLLAIEAAARREEAEAMEWLRRGRADEAPSRREEAAADWDMLELRVRLYFEKPEDWVPRLAKILNQYEGNEKASMTLTSHLVSLRLLRATSHPDHPGQILLDSRPLQQLLTLYGPRVQTAAEVLGVSATQGGIWTPESAVQGPSIWTPGSGSSTPSQTEKPRIILPGQ
jgi:tetratricopeptide (TPR) repeat protein